MTAEPDETEIDDAGIPTSRPRGPAKHGNVGTLERIASTVVGSVLVVRGLRRRSLSGAATALFGGALAYRGLTGRSRLYRLLGVNATAEESLDEGPPDRLGLERTIIVGEPADELATYWRDPEHVDRIAGRFADVSGGHGTEDRHRWRVDAPLGRTLEWEATLVEDDPGERLRWRSLEGAPIDYECAISFRPAPGDRGTAVELELQYDPPGGPLGDAVLSRFGTPMDLIAGESLRRFKSLAETGEIPTVEGNPSGRGRGGLR
ncbi:YgaP-like transmembrane domain [Halobiforma nitratireducens]|uniref:Cyclase n=1 Tax=Halobiforma nitratireducens JCM 10879 TaxID=1227454 RepID=M0LG69_9EURY|nr:YgaP-like transmembrane domain [Halobiforma nitratireducens]EMA31439.1 cyclase [Halobiforma nitratireducens JCM 10879]